ncbi:hypothetical protein [Rhodococcoides kroppenstedtii]|uniref:hypothetical protein n=1 Tax=Rhodococcoides kroppenstedtii TaxID=293050 RepID=UPI003636DCA8
MDKPAVSFIVQSDPPDEYGRALYAVCRSILRALLDQLGKDELEIIQSNRDEVSLKQLAYVARLDRDKGMRGDGFEWAVHEALMGQENRVSDLVGRAMNRASKHIGASAVPSSVMFGYERAKHLGFMDAVVDEAGTDARLLPDGRGRPFQFGPWVRAAAAGPESTLLQGTRIEQIWKTDLFVTDAVGERYLAATVKSQWRQLEGGKGLRLAIVPEAKDLRSGVSFNKKTGLWMVALPDPDGFMGLFNDAYSAIAETIYSLGKHTQSKYWSKPSAKAQKIQDQLVKAANASVLEIEDALNDAAQQNLVSIRQQLVSVQAPPWLHLGKAAPKILAPKPRFDRID